MLVLTRKRSERIVIGENITITVINVGSNKVRLGIEAPRELAVDREEVAKSKQCEAWLQALAT